MPERALTVTHSRANRRRLRTTFNNATSCLQSVVSESEEGHRVGWKGGRPRSPGVSPSRLDFVFFFWYVFVYLSNPRETRKLYFENRGVAQRSWEPQRRGKTAAGSEGPLGRLGGRVGLCGQHTGEQGPGREATRTSRAAARWSLARQAATLGQARPRRPPGNEANSGMAREAGVPQRPGPSPLPPDVRPQLASEGPVSLSS